MTPPVVSGHVVLTPAARDVTLTGRIKPGTPRSSNGLSVSDSKAEFRRRYQEFLRAGLK